MEKTTKKAENTTNSEDYMRELVPYRLPLQKGSTGVYVNVNEDNRFIPRGEEVMIPRYIVEVLENSINQDIKTQQHIQALTSKV